MQFLRGWTLVFLISFLLFTVFSRLFYVFQGIGGVVIMIVTTNVYGPVTYVITKAKSSKSLKMAVMGSTIGCKYVHIHV